MKIFPIAVLTALLLAPLQTVAGEAKTAVMYKYPQCGCCEEYAQYLREYGFEVTVKPTHDMPAIKKMTGVTEPLEGCHTLMIDGYVVEGHVPITALNKLLTEKPAISGISLPGMPQGSPGMTGVKTEPFEIYEITSGEPQIYSIE